MYECLLKCIGVNIDNGAKVLSAKVDRICVGRAGEKISSEVLA